MKYVLVTYRDKDLNSFLAPTISNTDNFERLAKDVTTSIIRGPKEKLDVVMHRELYGLGYYDDDTGVIEPVVPVKLLDCDVVINKRINIDKDTEKVVKDA